MGNRERRVARGGGTFARTRCDDHPLPSGEGAVQQWERGFNVREDA